MVAAIVRFCSRVREREREREEEKERKRERGREREREKVERKETDGVLFASIKYRK
jgi:hypothetical protein